MEQLKEAAYAFAGFLGYIHRPILTATIYSAIAAAILFIPFRKRHYWQMV